MNNSRPLRSHLRLIFLTVACSVSLLRAQTAQSVPPRDRIRLAEAFRIMDEFGDRLWSNWSGAPSAVLLVTPRTEFLIHHPDPSKDFKEAGYDSLLKSMVYTRPRVFQTSFLATFPAVNGVLTIVVGQAENTEAKESSRWVLSVLHEHFHQLQYSQPEYFRKVSDLDLSKGDQTGMWMLNFPFPYDSVDVYREFALVAGKLQEAILAPQPEFRYRLHRYLDFRKQLAAMLTPEAARYLDFQLWQEGIARYTELALAALVAREFVPSPAFQSLDDFVPFGRELDNIRFGTISELGGISLNQMKRTAFYSFGASEGILLDRCHPGWRKEYFEHPFSLEGLFRDE